MFPMLGAALGAIGGGGGGIGGSLPGMQPPGSKADASATALVSQITPTLNQNFGSGTQYNKNTPSLTSTADTKGGTATAGGGNPPQTGTVQATTAAGPSGPPWGMILLAAVALAVVIFNRKS